jgi:hypothetical protein
VTIPSARPAIYNTAGSDNRNTRIVIYVAAERRCPLELQIRRRFTLSAAGKVASSRVAQNRKLFSVLRELSVTLVSNDRNDKYDLSSALRRWKG